MTLPIDLLGVKIGITLFSVCLYNNCQPCLIIIICWLTVFTTLLSEASVMGLGVGTGWVWGREVCQANSLDIKCMYLVTTQMSDVNKCMQPLFNGQ